MSLEKITSDLSKAKIDVQFAEKKPAGTRGDSIKVKTNITKISLKPNIPFFKYDLRMMALFDRKGTVVEKELTKQTRNDFPEQIRKAATVNIFKKITSEEKQFFGSTKSVFYDRAAILFTLSELKLGGEEKVFDRPANYIKGYDDAVGFKIIIKKCTEGFQASTNDVGKVCNAQTSLQDKTVLEALNLICGQVPLMENNKFVTYGNGMHYCFDPMDAGFSQRDFPALPDGKYLGGGAHKSVRILEGDAGKATPYVVTEIKKTAFHTDNQPLLEKIQAFSMFSRGGFSVQGANNSQRAIRDQLKGLFVETTHSKVKRNFPITGISEPANKKTVKLPNGSTMTVEKYFADKYGIRLKYAGLFMVSTRTPQGELHYPVEVLTVGGSQRVISAQQTPDQIQIMIKACASLPADRLRQTETMKKVLGLDGSSQWMSEAGMTVDSQLAVVPARVLPAPTLQYAAKKMVQPVDNCKWNGDGAQFIVPVTIPKWMVVGLFQPNDAGRFPFDEYVKQLMAMMSKKGMKVGQPLSERHDRVNESVVEAVFAKAKAASCPFIFFISSDNIKLHDFIKKMEVTSQILTQEVRVSKALGVLERGQRQTLENVVSKTNLKLGGLNAIVLLGKDPKVQAWINDESRVFIGFEISNPAPLSQAEISQGVAYKMPSVLGWGANCGKMAQYWLGDYKYVEPRQSDMMGSSIKELIKSILAKFRTARGGKPPAHIVMFFSGVSEGQYNMISNEYMDSVRKGLFELSPNFKPKLTAVAVTKEHNERLFKQTITGTNAAQQNIAPGTVVDSVVVSPSYTEFYLNAHSAFQGTAKSPKYAVIMDDSKMPSDVLQGMCHGLCYQHGIVNMTVSLPAPLMVANRCAKRGHNVWICDQSCSTANGMNLEAANDNLTNNNKRLGLVRYNA